jgi:uncharacterized repeat protein (TIGR03943 family)
VVTGALLVVLALAVGTSAWRDHRAGRRQPHRSGLVGWLIVLPVVVALCVDAQALGAYTIRQGPGYTRVLARDFDLESHLHAHSFAGQAAELQLHQFLSAAGGSPDERRLLADTQVRLTGFVVNDNDHGAGNGGNAGGGFDLARLMIGCCAGDAVGLIVHVADYRGDPLADETWVEVTGTFTPGADDTGPAGEEAPVLELASLRTVDQPGEPYEYPY